MRTATRQRPILQVGRGRSRPRSRRQPRSRATSGIVQYSHSGSRDCVGTNPLVLRHLGRASTKTIGRPSDDSPTVCVGRDVARQGDCDSGRRPVGRGMTALPHPHRGASAPTTVTLAVAADEIHYFQEPIGRQFRFATERQSDSSRVLAEGSPGCKHERSRYGGIGGGCPAPDGRAPARPLHRRRLPHRRGEPRVRGSPDVAPHVLALKEKRSKHGSGSLVAERQTTDMRSKEAPSPHFRSRRHGAARCSLSLRGCFIVAPIAIPGAVTLFVAAGHFFFFFFFFFFFKKNC